MALSHPHPRTATRRAAVIALLVVAAAVGVLAPTFTMRDAEPVSPGPRIGATQARPSLVADRAEWYALRDGQAPAWTQDAISRMARQPVRPAESWKQDAITRMTHQPDVIDRFLGHERVAYQPDVIDRSLARNTQTAGPSDR